MVRRVFLVAGVSGLLAGLIFYSQSHIVANRVSGIIEADEIRVGSRLGGRVLNVRVQEGERVSQGDILVELEPYDLLQLEQEALKSLQMYNADLDRLSTGLRAEEIAQAKARFDQASARYEMLVAGPRKQEIEAARSRKQLAESDAALAQRNYDRSKKLSEREAIAPADFDASREKLQAAQAMLDVRHQEFELMLAGNRKEEIREAKARVDEAEQAWLLAKNGFRKEEIVKARAARDAAQAALDVVSEHKKELQIIAPTDGVIEALELQKGDLVPSGGPVLSILDDGRMWVRAYVPQNRVGIKIGQRLAVTVDAFPEERFIGQVSFVSRQAEFTPNNVQTPEERSKQVFRIKVVLDADSGKLRPGMTADVWLTSL